MTRIIQTGAAVNRQRVTLREEGIEITWRDTGWHTLAGEMRPGTIGAELLEMEQQEVVA